MITFILVLTAIGSLCAIGTEGSAETCSLSPALCNDVSSSIDSNRGSVREALQSWVLTCVDAELCKRAIGNGTFLFRCAQKILVLRKSQGSALKLMRYAARLVAEAAWKGPLHLEQKVPCRRPTEPDVGRLFDEDLLEVSLEDGRRCNEGNCNDKCGLVVLDNVISIQEVQELVLHAEAVKLQHAEHVEHLETSSTKTSKIDLDLHLSSRFGQGDGHILFLYVLEVLRNLVALAAEVPLSWVHFASHFLSHLSPNKDTGASRGTIHCDESSFERFHYSAVLWLTKQDSRTGGEIQFWDDFLRDWRVTLQPEVGRAALFTSGWENIHRVTPLRVGQRWSLPLFASVYAPFNSTRLSKACLWPKSSKQWQYCEDRLQWLSAPDEDIY